MSADPAELRSTILELLSDAGTPLTIVRLRNLLERQEAVTLPDLRAALSQLGGRVVVEDGRVRLADVHPEPNPEPMSPEARRARLFERWGGVMARLAEIEKAELEAKE